jgi:hypothetical protein
MAAAGNYNFSRKAKDDTVVFNLFSLLMPMLFLKIQIIIKILG